MSLLVEGDRQIDPETGLGLGKVFRIKRGWGFRRPNPASTVALDYLTTAANGIIIPEGQVANSESAKKEQRKLAEEGAVAV